MQLEVIREYKENLLSLYRIERDSIELIKQNTKATDLKVLYSVCTSMSYADYKVQVYALVEGRYAKVTLYSNYETVKYYTSYYDSESVQKDYTQSKKTRDAIVNFYVNRVNESDYSFEVSYRPVAM